MMSIGVFGRRVGLSAGALRFYDDCGVLRPARVDGDTGYRFYAEGQVERAVRVRRLRAAGVPLAEVTAVLDGDPAGARALLEAHARRMRETAEAAREAVGELLRELPEGVATARVGGAEFASAVRQVVSATASGAVREEFPVLGCVLVEVDGPEVRLVATDRYRLAVRTLRADADTGGPRGFLVGAEHAGELARWAVRWPEVRVEAGPDGVLLRGPDGVRTVTVHPGEYPDWRVVLDGLGAVRNRVVVDRTELRSALAGASGPVVTLSAGDGGLAGPGGPVPRALCDGPPLRISFDPEVLLAAVDAGVGPDVLLEIRSATGPVAVRSADQGSFTTLVMPVRETSEGDGS
ncbi:transcriptional regulator [Streptomyces uncialis]|uniref:Transcriptional regulator n=2 Tax=Streptomyces uncialis TaxID=1048205 RepID=A0A1Q4V0L7_9ACTN|nr:transcriptional regulator [Streptomyces uncialis]